MAYSFKYTGTIVNGGAIIIGGLFGLFFKKYLSEEIEQMFLKTTGLITCLIGIDGTLKAMAIVENAALNLLIALLLGSFIGYVLQIEYYFTKLGIWLKELSKSDHDNNFIDAFLNASLTVSIGAMAIIGSLNEGLYNDPTILFTKAIIDFAIIMAMSATMGKGSIYSFIPVIFLEGLLTFLASLTVNLFNETVINAISLSGNVLIITVGLNLLHEKMFKTANMLPALIISALLVFIL